MVRKVPSPRRAKAELLQWEGCRCVKYLLIPSALRASEWDLEGLEAPDGPLQHLFTPERQRKRMVCVRLDGKRIGRRWALQKSKEKNQTLLNLTFWQHIPIWM